MTEVTFRKMRETDLVDVITIEKETFPDPWNYDAFKSDLTNELCWPIAALSDGMVVGYSVLYIVAGELQIGNFAISPSHRRKGIGKKMMDEIIKIAHERHCDSIYLEVRESNKAAQDLYASFGFVTVGRRVGYYRHPRENAILMAREL
jgi:ribosomal-protein-alanine N-acetyltransferase